MVYSREESSHQPPAGLLQPVLVARLYGDMQSLDPGTQQAQGLKYKIKVLKKQESAPNKRAKEQQRTPGAGHSWVG